MVAVDAQVDLYEPLGWAHKDARPTICFDDGVGGVGEYGVFRCWFAIAHPSALQASLRWVSV